MQANINTNPSQPPLVRGGEVLHVPGWRFIPYNKELVSLARELRSNETQAEKVFWKALLVNKKMINYKFTRQKPLDGFKVDFYCVRLLLAIESDGKIHLISKARDRERTNIIKDKYGILLIRYENDKVLNNMKYIIEDLKKVIYDRERDLGPLIRGI